jgi:tetratricopeptide (TPR) repeat protein
MRCAFVLLVLTIRVWSADGIASTEANTALTLARQGKYEQAIPHYKAALGKNPRLPGLYLNYGLALFKVNRLDQAASAFEHAASSDPANFQIRALLGMSYYGTRKFAAAAGEFKRALEQQPDNTELRYKLAQSYMWAGQHEAAIDEFRGLLLKDPDSAPVHMLLGEVLDAANRTDEAIAEFETAAKSASREPEVHFGRGYLYWKQKRFDEARRAFEAELSNQPGHALALAYLGDAEMQSGAEAQAKGHLERALQLDRNVRLAHLDLGAIAAGRKELQTAAQHFRAAIRIDSSKPDAHYRLARTLLALGREHEAKAEFDYVKKLAAADQPDPLMNVKSATQGR